MITSEIEKRSWLDTAFQFKGSTLLVVLPRVFLFGGFGALISLVQPLELPVNLEVLGDFTNNVASNLVLGLLLVFRTNSAYDRYWEGRKAWGVLAATIRNLAREMQMNILATDPTAQTQKLAALKLLGGFAIATRRHLRQQPPAPELDTLLSSAEQPPLSQFKNPPFEITLRLSRYFQRAYQQQQLDGNQCFAANTLLNQLTEGLTSCERILKTPIPPAYASYLKGLLFIYCFFLPFSLVDKLEYWTAPVTAIISAILLGVEEIGNEIEDPFGMDSNDLPLDELCNTIAENVEQAIASGKE